MLHCKKGKGRLSAIFNKMEWTTQTHPINLTVTVYLGYTHWAKQEQNSHIMQHIKRVRWQIMCCSFFKHEIIRTVPARKVLNKQQWSQLGLYINFHRRSWDLESGIILTSKEMWSMIIIKVLFRDLSSLYLLLSETSFSDRDIDLCLGKFDVELRFKDLPRNQQMISKSSART